MKVKKISNLLVFLPVILHISTALIRPFLNPLKASGKLKYINVQFELPLAAEFRPLTKIARKGDALVSLSLTLSNRNNDDNHTRNETDDKDVTQIYTPGNKNFSSSSESPLQGHRDINHSNHSDVASINLDMNSNDKSYQGSLLESYFPFLQSSQPTARTDYQSVSDLGIGDNNSSTASKILKKEANDAITVADLEVILSQMELPPYKNRVRDLKSNALPVRSKSASFSKQTANTKMIPDSSHVAFPQPSILSEHELQRGTSIAGCFLGMIIGITILPNLWLVGMIMGSFYGYDLTKGISTEGNTREDPNIFGKFLISCGRKLAKAYLQLVDYWKGLWFLYKTGQLSYEYYKTYENLDKKFAIQSKVDAWNRIFVQGKQKFDAWEQENEVGRTVLAGLRTAWLVDEQSRQRAAGRSKYRLVQAAYDVNNSISRSLRNLFVSIKSLFEEGEIKSFLKGLRTDMSQKGSIATRIGAVAVAIVAVNISGAIFSISPAFSNILAIVLAIIWPSWAADLASRAQEVGMEIKSRGLKEQKSLSGNSVKVFDPVKFIRRRCKEHRSDNPKQSTRNNKRNRKQKFASKAFFSPFHLIGDGGKSRPTTSAKVGTWRNSRR